MLLFAVLAAACSHAQPIPHGRLTPPLVNPKDIIDGGPPPDGIPPIDHPVFVDPAEANRFLTPEEPVIALEVNGAAKAYPLQILIWHEIVNDRIGGAPVSVTYCPLCNTSIVFRRPVIDGELLDFGTSGKLYQSDLVMYDRQTKSLWPQVLGAAAVGPLLGAKLQTIPSQIVSWADWRAADPNGKVLSPDTGVRRPYGTNPYAGYDRPESTPFAFVGTPDPRLPPKERVVGVRVGDHELAFPYTEIETGAAGDWSVAASTVGGRDVVVFWKDGTVSAVDAPKIADSRPVGATGAFDPSLDGRALTFHATTGGIVDDQTGSTWDVFGRAIHGPLAGQALDRIASVDGFWFAWAAFYPKTVIFRR